MEAIAGARAGGRVPSLEELSSRNWEVFGF
jgi:hypothetical protein